MMSPSLFVFNQMCTYRMRRTRSQVRLLVLLFIFGELLSPQWAEAAPEFAGATRLFEIEQAGSFKRSAPAVERLKNAKQFYSYSSASSHTGFEQARRSLIFLYRDIRTDELALFLTHGIDDLGQPEAQQQPSATVEADILGVPNGARIAEQDDSSSEFNWGANVNQTRGNLTGSGPPIALGRWSFGSNTDGGALDRLPTDQDWEISVSIRLIRGINEWAYFFADGSMLTLDPDRPLILRSLGGSQEADQVTSVEGQAVTFCALATDTTSNTLTYTFQWQDGSPNSEVIRVQGELACADHSFPDNGTYDVRVIATNTRNQSSSKIIQAVISNAPPVVIPGGPFMFDIQVPVTLEVNDVQDPGSSDTHELRWDFDGDGTWDTPFRAGLTAPHIYERAGRYFARVQARDNEGLTGLATMTVYAGVPPEVYTNETDPNILIAGYSPTDPSVPFPVYRGAPITLKAILRNTVSCANYQVIWDTDEDGEFEENGDDIVLNNLSPTNGSVYDVGQPYTIPANAQEGRHLIAIRATNTCNGFVDYDVMRLYVYPWTPSLNPLEWSKQELDVMVQIGVQEGLWYMHRKQGGRSGSGAQVQSYLNASGSAINQATALAVWAFTINGRLPAYPKDSVNTHGHTLPDGWEEDNLIRWRLDPYSETVTRMVNYIMNNGAARTGVNAADEQNTCDLNGTQCPRLGSSYANQGAYTNGGSNYTYAHGVNTGALSTVLPALAGTPIQTGNLAGQLWEGFIQDQVDYLGYLQIESGCAQGGWYYNRTSGESCGYMDGSTAQWGYIGLESAEVAGFRYGVFVNNRHKYKTAYAIVRNQDGYGSSAYRTDGGWSNNNLTLTGGFFVISRWLGFQTFNSGDGAQPFAPYSSYTKGQMRDALQRARNYTSGKWGGTEAGDYHINRRFWSTGSYTCGDTQHTYKWSSNATCGNLYGMYSHQKGYRTTFKTYDRTNGEIQEGPLEGNIGGHDWEREFSSYVIRSQERNPSDYSNFGRIDDCSGGGTISCSSGGYNLGITMGTLILTPTVFKPRPVADGEVIPPEVLQGCASPDAGWVTLSHQASFHPNPKSKIDHYEWDMDDSDGYWWDGNGSLDNITTPRIYFDANGDPLDGAKRKLRYQYQRPGTFKVTLRVVDGDGEFNLKTFKVRVLPMQPSDPVAIVRDGGGRYIADAKLTEQLNNSLRLKGKATDLNSACGDTLSIRWTIDGRGQPVPAALQNKINGLRTAEADISKAELAGITLGHAYGLRLTVTDSTGRISTDTTDLVIFPTHPVANWSANPVQARCGQNIVFDAQNSFHPFSPERTQANANDPSRVITEYKWDLDGLPGFERIGEAKSVEHSYNRYGTYTARLQVCDSVPYCDVGVPIVIEVNQGNKSPVASLPFASLIHLTEDDLTISAGASYDPDVLCGDRIVSYRWYFNPVDESSPAQFEKENPELALTWAQLQPLLRGPADPRTGLPNNQIVLEVEDTLGLTHRATMTLTLYPREPIAHFDQLPSPAPIDEETGEVSVELDARESFSPRPDGRVVNWAWDLNNDGQYNEFIGQSVVTVRKIFEPVPSPVDIPAPIVGLRVTDDRGEIGDYRIPLSYGLGDVPPTADADPSDAPELGYHILLGDSLFLNGSQSIEPNDADWVRYYRWWVNSSPNAQWDNWQFEAEDADGDGQEAVFEVTPAMLADLGVTDIGEYPVAFLAEDTTLRTSNDLSKLTVHAASPIAKIVVPRTQVSCGEQFTLNGSGSGHAHPQINIVSYEWDFDGDGLTDREGEQVLFTANQFSFDGPQVITLRVTDSRGNTSEDHVEISVDQGNNAPRASVGGPYAISVSDSVIELDASGSSDAEEQCGDEIVSYEWDLDGDGNYASSALERQFTHDSTPTLTQAEFAPILRSGDPLGAYSIGVRVRDKWGELQENRGEIRVYRGPQAVAIADPPRAACDTDVRFSGLASTTDGPLDQGFRIVSYAWDFDQDGEVDSAEALAIYRVGLGGADVEATLTITDEAGRSASTSVTFEINLDNNVSPVADAGGPYATGPINPAEMTPIDLDARASFDPDEPCDAITIYKWDTDGDGLYGADDSNGAGNRAGSDYSGAYISGFVDPTWEVGLTKLVRVVVCDGRGACSPPAVQEVNVRPNPPPTGELLSPRSDECLTSQDTFDITFKYRDPDGGSTRMKVFIDDIEVHRENFIAADDGSDREATMTVDISDLPDGLHTLELEVGDFLGAITRINPGGPIMVDRNPPTVDFSQLLLSGACYPPGQAPDPQPAVSDDLDSTPSMELRYITEACLRTVQVTARDECGNTTVAERSFREAGPVSLVIEGPADNELVGGESAQFVWTHDGPENCISSIHAEINSEGGGTWVYQEGTEVVDPGAATLTLTVKDCANQSYLTTRSFRVNAPPIARPQPPGHPNSVPLAAIPTYQVQEGSPLLLEASSSTAPEDDDQIVAYRWDFDGDGQVDAQGVGVNAVTGEDGSFEGQLVVEDRFGATHTQAFELIVLDVDPFADAGGPYQGLQGRNISFNGRNSSAANPSDLLANDPQNPQRHQLTWDWGDGEITEGSHADVALTTHSYAEDGLYQVRLTVRDEDSESTTTVRVSVGDVRPTINQVTLPQAPYALQNLKFIVDATAGAPLDQIVSYQWDFLGDGNFEEFPEAIAPYRYLEAGDYQITLRVADKDSFTQASFQLSVRDVTLSDLLREVESEITQLLDHPDTTQAVKLALAPSGMPPLTQWISRGLWSETQRTSVLSGAVDAEALAFVNGISNAPDLTTRMASLYRGNTLQAYDEILFRLNRAQNAGARFGVLLWKISRQLLRETESAFEEARAAAAVAFDEGHSPFIPEEDERLISANEQLVYARSIFEDIDYLDRVTTRDGFLARDLHAALGEAHFLIRDSSDIAHRSEDFKLSGAGDATAQVAEGNLINQDLIRALNQLYGELQAYEAVAVDQGQGEGPGLASVQSAMVSLEEIDQWVTQPIGLRCPVGIDPDDPRCQFLNDQDSLSLQLALMDLVGELFAAADAGVYVRNAQQMLTVAVKFRVEVALLRVEELCGLNNPYPLSARAQQRVLLNLLEDGQRDAALLYYIAPERRCLVYEQYNECVIPALNQQNAPDEPDREGVAYPALCDGLELFERDGVQAQIDLALPIPPREAFTDLSLLFKISDALNRRLDVSNDVIRARSYPDTSWEDFNRDTRDNSFDLNDLYYAIMQFNHDRYDYDGDGLSGLYEIDCQLRFGLAISPTNIASIQGEADALQDCDGDGIPNLEEVDMFLNPVEPADAALDTDGDGMSNKDEWLWAKKGLEVDMRDPTDGDEDQDGDGVKNRLEVIGGLDPLNPADASGDFDQDGLTNGQELNNGLNPRDATDADTDPDNDGLSSREEINRGRNPLVADCEDDLAEAGQRNDHPLTYASPLQASQEGLICSVVGDEDVDWYEFEVTRENQRFTARLLTDSRGLSLSLFQANGAQIESSRGDYQDSLIALPRGQLSVGTYWLKVSHQLRDLAPQVTYSLEYQLIDPDAPCLPDAWEGEEGNNQRGLATVLGADETRFGNVWVCQEERNVGDWYIINLNGVDKTVHVGFAPTSDGRLELAAMDQDLTRYAESVAQEKSAQCLNIRANGQQGLLYLRVTAAVVYSDGDERVDYTMQVLDTDLDANPRGECDTLNNGLFDFFTWPTLDY